MRVPSALVAALGSWLVLNAKQSMAKTSEAAPQQIRVNGWYNCTRTTFSVTGFVNFDEHDDDYFFDWDSLETSTDDTSENSDENGADNVQNQESEVHIKIHGKKTNSRNKPDHQELRHRYHASSNKKHRDAKSKSKPSLHRKHSGLSFLDSTFERTVESDPLKTPTTWADYDNNQGQPPRKAAGRPVDSPGNQHHRNHRHHAKDAKHHRRLQDGPKYECAEFEVPMCYEGICESDRKINVFVKRAVPPNIDELDEKKSLWVLQGGPGASSTAMESLLQTMYSELDGKVTIYTMDHRGTARSNRLECPAASALSSGSPNGVALAVEEVPGCIQDVLFQIDNQTDAFSVTSAAMDIYTVLTNTSLAEEEAYVYGLSYGTYVVERLIHLAPESVKGYAIDGIVSESGGTIEERSTYSNWDHDVGIVAERFLHKCEQDMFCKSKFPDSDDLLATVKQLYKDLDDAAAKNPGSNKCADVLAQSGLSPSYFLRSTFGYFVSSDSYRLAIMPILHRVMRCAAKDVDALKALVESQSEEGDVEIESDVDVIMFASDMLYNLIVFSEMWERPTPDRETLVKWFEDAVFASQNYYTLSYYCLFTGMHDDACKEMTKLPKSLPFVYKRDQYWNTTAELPPQATALLMSGGLDPQTVSTYGKLEYNSLKGKRMLVEFDDASHCTTFSTPMKTWGSTCGVKILASYVRESGELTNVDTSCIDQVRGLEFSSVPSYISRELFDTENAFGD